MYKILIRPLFFLISPERIHEILVKSVKILYRLPGSSRLFRKLFSQQSPILEKDFLGLKFKNPVGLAAGFDKNADFYKEFSQFGFGFIEIGTVTPRPQPGNPKPRSFRLPVDKALVNRMGLNNLGADAVVSCLKNRNTDLVIGGNIGKNTDTPAESAVEDFVTCFEKLYDYVDYFVINISCPNTGEIEKLQDQEVMERIIHEIVNRRALKRLKKPVLLKISPDLTNEQVDEVLYIIEKYRIEGIVATNTTLSRENLSTHHDRIAAIGRGGLSGAPLRARSTEIIRYISSKTGGKLPVIGVGGIMTPGDALEKLEAGAGLVQVYTGFVYEGPSFVKKILKAIMKQDRLKEN